MFHDYRMISPKYADKLAITLAFPWRLGATGLFARPHRPVSTGRQERQHGIHSDTMTRSWDLWMFMVLISNSFVCMNMIEYD